MFKTNIPPPPYSSPSQREGEEIGGGGHFEHLNFEHCFGFRNSKFEFRILKPVNPLTRELVNKTISIYEYPFYCQQLTANCQLPIEALIDLRK